MTYYENLYYRILKVTLTHSKVDHIISAVWRGECTLRPVCRRDWREKHWIN